MLVREFNAEVFTNTVLFNDFPLGRPVLACQRFVKAILHDIAKLVQFGAIVGNCIVIAEPSYFSIVLIEDGKVCSVNQFPTMCGLPNLFSIMHYYRGKGLHHKKQQPAQGQHQQKAPMFMDEVFQLFSGGLRFPGCLSGSLLAVMLGYIPVLQLLLLLPVRLRIAAASFFFLRVLRAAMLPGLIDLPAVYTGLWGWVPTKLCHPHP